MTFYSDSRSGLGYFKHALSSRQKIILYCLCFACSPLQLGLNGCKRLAQIKYLPFAH